MCILQFVIIFLGHLRIKESNRFACFLYVYEVMWGAFLDCNHVHLVAGNPSYMKWFLKYGGHKRRGRSSKRVIFWAETRSPKLKHILSFWACHTPNWLELFKQNKLSIFSNHSFLNFSPNVHWISEWLPNMIYMKTSTIYMAFFAQCMTVLTYNLHWTGSPVALKNCTENKTEYWLGKRKTLHITKSIIIFAIIIITSEISE